MENNNEVVRDGCFVEGAKVQRVRTSFGKKVLVFKLRNKDNSFLAYYRKNDGTGLEQVDLRILDWRLSDNGLFLFGDKHGEKPSWWHIYESGKLTRVEDEIKNTRYDYNGSLIDERGKVVIKMAKHIENACLSKIKNIDRTK